jgi:hypothetical protein
MLKDGFRIDQIFIREIRVIRVPILLKALEALSHGFDGLNGSRRIKPFSWVNAKRWLSD